MLHLINQYKKLFCSFIFADLNNSAESAWSSEINDNWNLSFKEALSKALDNKVLEPNEAKDLLDRLEWERREEIRYTRESAKILVDSIWVKWNETWISKKSLKEKLKEISVQVQSGEIVTQSEPENKEKTINTDVFNRTLKEWSEGSDVMALQEFLISKWLLKPTYKNKEGELVSNADWKFWRATKKALMKFQKSIWYTKPDGVLTVSNKRTYKTLAAIKGLDTNNDYKWSSTNVYGRKADIKDVKKAVEYSGNRLDALQKLNENSDEFYKALEAYYDGWFRKDTLSDMWGVLGWLKEVVWANNANEYFEKMKTYKDKIWDKEDKFNEQLAKVLPKRKDSNGNEYTERWYSLWNYAIRDIIIMAVFQDLPLFDIRLNFAKNLVSHGVPMDKTKALKDWVDAGMEGEPDFSKENLDKISGKDALSSLWRLRSTLTAYGFSNDQINDALRWDLSNLTKKQKKVINTIINDRIVPDLETLRIGGFNFIERWFDKKDSQIKNKINQLTWNKYEIWSIKDIIWGENNDTVSLQKVWKYYILSVDDLGYDSYKVFTKRPTKSDIKKSLKEYNEDKWKTERNIREKLDISNSDKEIVQYYWYETDDNKLLVVNNDWSYQILDANKNISSDDIDSSKFKKSKVDDNISIEEKLRLTWEILDLLKIQDTEDWFFWTEDWLKEWIQRVDSRYEYTKWINNERKFLLKAVDILKTEDKNLFKIFSMISTFWTVSDFMKAFPSNDLEVRWFLSALQTADSVEKYVDILKQINSNKNLKDYFTIVFNAHKNNAWMRAWKNYRIGNIPRETGLKRINTSNDRRFKYGEPLDINATWEEALNKMKSETTEKWWNRPSMNILWNIVSWMILKAGITDVTTADLENAIKNKWESIPLSELNENVINTAKSRRFSNDQITTFPKLQFEKWDTHAFHTTVEKDIVLYKKNWEKVNITKTYDIYFRPECNNLLIIPWSNSQLSKLNQADFNMDISSLKTKTLPITLMMIKWAIDSMTPDKWTDKWASSMPVDWDPIEIPTTPNQPSM